MVTTKETKAKAPPKTSNTRRIATLIVGDALAFLVFAAIGRSSHGEATGLAAIPQIALTAAPFAAAWFIVAPSPAHIVVSLPLSLAKWPYVPSSPGYSPGP